MDDDKKAEDGDGGQGGDNPEAGAPIQVGVNGTGDAVVLKIGGRVHGMNIETALMLGHSITGKALSLLIGAMSEGEGGGGQPGDSGAPSGDGGGGEKPRPRILLH